MLPSKSLATRNINVRYDNFVSSGLKVMTKFKYFTRRSRSQVKRMVPCEKCFHKEYMINIKTLPLLWPRLNFFKSRSEFKVTRSKLWHHMKSFVTSNTYAQYEILISSGIKVMVKDAVFLYWSNFKKLLNKLKSLLTSDTFAKYELYLFLCQRLKFFFSKIGLISRSRTMIPSERSCHKEYTCTIWKPYLQWFECSDQVNFISKIRQTLRLRS